MATLVLQAAGAFAGNLIGGPFGAIIGQAAGALAGSVVDQQIFGAGGKNSTGPRLTRLPGLSAAEGTPMARVYGRARTGGTLIWMTRFEEAASVARSGGAGGKGSSPKTTTYSYFGNFAVGICEGTIAEVRRIWADGEELDQTRFTIRVYKGDEEQSADPLIVAKEGAINAPAYKGLAYIVIERMPLGDFGNRIPQFSFEVVRPVGVLNEMVRAVCIIPGSSEFAYQPASVMGSLGSGISQSENRHVLTRSSDWEASLDSLQSLCPNLKSVALVVAWFGDDLRADHCTIRPLTEKSSKVLNEFQWSVAGLTRGTASQVSSFNGKPAYGGTPSDVSVLAAISDLKARGLNVVLYPFVMMDIASSNALPDPWTGSSSQPAYPWRGRITCNPSSGQAGTPDGTSAAASQISTFFGSASPSGSEWSYRRFILHCANLCAQAGGVDAFLIGSELIGLTRVRSGSGVYPAVSALSSLASDVKSIVGSGTKVSYAADWTEYGAHVLGGGSEVRFPLDSLWASSAIDFIGIDAYWPLADWREGMNHADNAQANSIYDVDYLRRGVTSGEAFDWYYADEAAREAQTRSPISDGAYGKPWVFRQKDIRGWWSNFHVERVAGVELFAPTAWTPASKPIWFTETGCPAVDKGANTANVFPDSKSSESTLPWFSRGFRDDLMQVRALEATITRFDAAADGYVVGDNPMSPVYGGPMVDADRLHLWAWDARPFPAFPQQASVWADSEAWYSGHWLNGRLEAAPLDRLVLCLAGDVTSPAGPIERPRINGIIDGYLIEHPISARNAIEPLASLYNFDPVVSSGRIRFIDRAKSTVQDIPSADLIPRKDFGLLELKRSQESELVRQFSIGFYDGETDYRTATVSSRRLEGGALREGSMDIAIVTTRAEAQRRAEILLQDIWAGRDEASFQLPGSYLQLEVGDQFTITVNGSQRQFVVNQISDSAGREISGREIVPSIFDHPPPQLVRFSALPPAIIGPPHVEFIDLAIARSEPATLQYLSLFADPWPGRMAVWRAIGSSTFAFLRYVDQPSIIGETLQAFGSGVVGRFDYANSLLVKLQGGAFSATDEAGAFAGRNALAIQGSDGGWEMLSFLNAELVGVKTWKISKFIRGLGGAEGRAGQTVAAGARIILLDEAVASLTTDIADLGQTHRYRVGPADRDYGDPAYVEVSSVITNLALKPFSPVRPRLARTGAGIEISFLRRGRVDSDGWDPVNIPLGEAVESYEIDIFNGTSLVRTIGGNTTTILYASSQEIADFGAAQSQLDILMCQKSDVAGRGFSNRGTFPVL